MICPKNVISKVALLQQCAKSIHPMRNNVLNWTVDISLTPDTRVHKSGIFEVASQMLQLIHTGVQLLKSRADKSS